MLSTAADRFGNVSDVVEQIQSLFDRAAVQEEGPVQSALIEEAVRLADSIQDEWLQFFTRISYVSAAFHAGEADKMMVALGWCVAAAERTPEKYPADVLIGGLEEAAAYVASFPDISRKQIEQLLDQLEQKTREAGLGLRSLYRDRCFNALWLGDHDHARELYATMAQHRDHKWQGDSLRLFQTDYHIQLGEPKQAYRVVAPILSRSDSSGMYIWAASFALRPLIDLQKWDEASEVHRRAYPLIQRNPKYIELVGHHLQYLAASGDLARGLTLLEKHLGQAIEASSIRSGFEFMLAGWALFRRVIVESTLQVSIRLPEQCPLASDTPPYSVPRLAAWLESCVRQREQQFNTRNGNMYFSRIVADRLAQVDENTHRSRD